MGFLQTIRKDLERSLAEQRRLALIAVLRQRAGAMTFDDLRDLLGSREGEALGPLSLAEVFGLPTEPAADKPPTKSLSKKASAKREAEKPAKKATRKRKRGRPASGSAKGPRQAKQAVVDAAGAPKRGKPGRPPGMSPEKAAAIVHYTEKVLGLIRAAGGWVATGDIHPQAGGTITQFHLALRKLLDAGAIVRQGERGTTRYSVPQS